MPIIQIHGKKDIPSAAADIRNGKKRGAGSILQGRGDRRESVQDNRNDRVNALKQPNGATFATE